MSGTPRGPSRLQRLVLRAYPPAWRAEHAEEMIAVLSDRGGRRTRPGDVADLTVRGLLARVRILPRLVPALALVGAVAASWTASRVAGPWSSLHLVWGFALTGITLVLAVTGVRARRRGEPGGAAGSRRVRTGCAVVATAVLVPPLVLCAYRVGEQNSWWNSAGIDLAVRSAVLVAPPDAVLILFMACTALLVAAWLLHASTWRGPALAAAGALALSSWLAQLRDLASLAPPGISFGFTPFAQVLSSHHFYLHGLPGVLLIASLAVTLACVAVPSHRHQPAANAGQRRAAP